MAATSSAPLAMRPTRRYARPCAPEANSRAAYAALAPLLRTTTPISGWSSRSRWARRMPSSVWVGAIGTPVTSTSGSSRTTAASTSLLARRAGDDLDVGRAVEHAHDPLPLEKGAGADDDARHRRGRRRGLWPGDPCRGRPRIVQAVNVNRGARPASPGAGDDEIAAPCGGTVAEPSHSDRGAHTPSVGCALPPKMRVCTIVTNGSTCKRPCSPWMRR